MHSKMKTLIPSQLRDCEDRREMLESCPNSLQTELSTSGMGKGLEQGGPGTSLAVVVVLLLLGRRELFVTAEVQA